MKSFAVIVLVLFAFLAQGTVADPELESLCDSISNPSTLQLVGNVCLSFKRLLKTGNILGSNVNTTVATTTTDILNGLITVSNEIVKRNVEYLTKGAKVIMNTLASGLNLITKAIKMAAFAVSSVITTITNTIGNVLNTLTQNIDACILKLNFLGMTTSGGRLAAYKLSLTTILNDLQTDITTEINEYSTYVSTSTITMALQAASISQQLTNELMTVALDPAASNSASFIQCIADSNEYITFVGLVLMENFQSCVSTSSASLTTISGGNTAALQESAQSSVHTVCKCVENITIFSLLSERLTAKACADTASAMLTTDPIETQATGILNSVVTQVDNVQITFNDCVEDILADIPDIVDFVSGMIQSCVGL